MPLPIKQISDLPRVNLDSNNYDVSFLMQSESKERIVTASDRDAEVLYKLWEKSSGSKEYILDKTFDRSDIIRLKCRGFIEVKLDKVSFTDRGRRVITTIALSEPNRFQKMSKQKKYTEILASMKAKKKGIRFSMSDLLRL